MDSGSHPSLISLRRHTGMIIASVNEAMRGSPLVVNMGIGEIIFPCSRKCKSEVQCY